MTQTRDLLYIRYACGALYTSDVARSVERGAKREFVGFCRGSGTRGSEAGDARRETRDASGRQADRGVLACHAVAEGADDLAALRASTDANTRRAQGMLQIQSKLASSPRCPPTFSMQDARWSDARPAWLANDVTVGTCAACVIRGDANPAAPGARTGKVRARQQRAPGSQRRRRHRPLSSQWRGAKRRAVQQAGGGGR